MCDDMGTLMKPEAWKLWTESEAAMPGYGRAIAWWEMFGELALVFASVGLTVKHGRSIFSPQRAVAAHATLRGFAIRADPRLVYGERVYDTIDDWQRYAELVARGPADPRLLLELALRGLGA